MESLKVYSWCRYPCLQPGTQGRLSDHLVEKHWNARWAIQIIKQRRLKGRKSIVVPGPKHDVVIDNSNLEDVRACWAWFVLEVLEEEFPNQPVVLVAVPNSNYNSWNPRQGTNTILLAEAHKLIERGPLDICLPLLYNKLNQGPVHSKGGNRSARSRFNNLDHYAPVTTLSCVPHVLIDDVVTTGNSLRACRAYLQGLGLKCDVAICAGTTDYNLDADPFSPPRRELKPFLPPPEVGYNDTGDCDRWRDLEL